MQGHGKYNVNEKVNVMKKYTSVSILHQSQDSDAGQSQDRESSQSGPVKDEVKNWVKIKIKVMI